VLNRKVGRMGRKRLLIVTSMMPAARRRRGQAADAEQAAVVLGAVRSAVLVRNPAELG